MKNNNYRELLQNSNYRKDLSASLINRFGDSIDAIASSWIVYEITGEAAWSAIIFAINQLPSIFVTPLAGPVVERLEKKKVMAFTDVIRAICVGILASGLLFGFLSAPLIALLTLVISTAEAFRVPAGTAMIPQLVTKEQYAHATSLNQSLSSIVALLGTGAAAVIIAAIGSAGAIYIDMATFLISAGIIMTMHLPEEGHMDNSDFSLKAYTTELKEGFLYCAGKKKLVSFTITILFLNGILVPLNSLQTPMISEIFHGSPLFLSVLGVSVTVSMLLGSVIFPMIHQHLSGKIALTLVTIGIAVFYLGVIGLSSFYTSQIFGIVTLAVLCGLLGLSVSIGNMYISVEMLKQIDQEYLARAAAIGGALGSAIVPVVAFIISIGVKFAAVSTMFLIAGIIALVYTVYILFDNSLDDAKAPERSKEYESI